MRAVSPRRPTLLDLMILTAATGAAVAMLRSYLAALRLPNFGPYLGFTRTQEAVYGSWSLVAAGWMLALLLIQWRRPRVSRSRLARRPGQVACIAALAALGAGAAQVVVTTTVGESSLVTPAILPYLDWVRLSNRVGPTILGAWIILAVSGRWRADPGWADRLGRLLGSLWVAWFLHLVIPFNIRSRLLALGEWVVS